ncbi:MAG: Ig-like domain-containing protein [Planctomycetes bacterium]|nr:Ig-like domain-containing protein [Planctomycetota bacterium]
MERTRTVSLVATLTCGVLFSQLSCSGGGSGGGGQGDPGRSVGRLIDHSPFDGEEGVALTRETILRFDEALDARSVRDSIVSVQAGSHTVTPRLFLARDGLTLTLFWEPALPAGETIEVSLRGRGLRTRTRKPVDLDGDGRPGGDLAFAFTTVALERVPRTDVSGRVFASEVEGVRNVPLAGVTVFVDGLESEAFTTTDHLGNFCLRDLPAGRLFVHIDGSTASSAPQGFYYPTVGKAWETRRGERINVGTIHLPAVAENALHETSRTQPVAVQIASEQLGRITDPALAQWLSEIELVVPADSLFANDGTRGGRVGIAPVARDRLPGVLPPGLNLPIVITVQTDGPSNFEVPAQITFPNLPDPTTGEALPPGTQTALWSFNHDTGRFEVVGTATVTPDGRFIESDPGEGIRAPGWHGTAPGSQGDGKKPRKPPTEPCKLRTWDITRTAYRVASELAACAVEVSKLRNAWRCFNEAKAFVDALLDQVDTIVQILQTQGTQADPSIIIPLIDDVIGKKNAAVGLFQCFETADPTSKIAGLISCARRALTIAEELCNLTANCTSIIGREIACRIIGPADALISELEGLFDLFEAWKRRAWVEVVCQAIERATSLARRYLGTDGLSQGEVDEIIQAMQEIRPAANGVYAIVPAFARTDATVPPAIGVSEDLTSSASRTAEDIAVPAEATFFYALQLGDDPMLEPRRGETGSTGTFSLIVPQDTPYVLAQYDPIENLYGESGGITARVGRRTTFGAAALIDASTLTDMDADGLADVAERVVGTREDMADTDGDGVSDRDELIAGTDPLDGIGGRPGVLYAIDAAAPAHDVCGTEGALILALGNTGIEVFNAWNGLEPASIGRMDTPGSATRVACAGPYVAVADGSAGLTIVDLNDPANPVVLHTLSIGTVNGVAATRDLAYAVTAEGQVVVVELAAGLELTRAAIGAGLIDVQVRGEFVYALADTYVHVLQRIGLRLQPVNTINVTRSSCRRLFLGDDHLVVTHWMGFVTFDVATDPANPSLLAATDTSQRGWMHLVHDGSGNALCVVGLNASPDTTNDLHLYDVRDPARPATFRREFANDGLANAIPVSVVSYNGLAYLADRRGKLLVVRTLLRDLGTEPPQVSLETNAPTGTIEEGKRMTLRARVQDDVLVRDVDFLVDGERIATDGSFPFEVTVQVPARSTATELVVSARAWDTGGNDRVTDDVTVAITADTTSPTVIDSYPRDAGRAIADLDDTVSLIFSEPIDPASLDLQSVAVVHAGPDSVFGTMDDLPLSAVDVAYRPELQSALFTLERTFPEGEVQVAVATTIRDIAGNALVTHGFTFTAITGLSMRMYRGWSSNDMDTFFASRTPDEFTVTFAGSSAERVHATVIPNVDFQTASGAWFVHGGANGVRETGIGQPASGDDLTFLAPGSAGSNYAVLVEGALRIEEAGDFVFSVPLDDTVALEIDGRRILSVLSGCRVTTVTSGVHTFAAGTYRFRMALGNGCPSGFVGILRANGPGFPGGVIPPRFFRP